MEKSRKKRNRFLSSAVAFMLCLSMLVEPVLATDSGGGSTPAPSASPVASEAPTEAPTQAPIASGVVLGDAGEFENFELGTDWAWNSGYEGVYEVCADDDTQAAPNGKYLKIKSNNSNAPRLQWASKVGDVTGGTEYTLKFYIKRYSETRYPTFVLAESSGEGFTDIVTLTTQGGTANSINGTEDVVNAWTECEYTFTTSADTNQLRIRLITHSRDTAGYDIDGISIVKTGSEPTPTVAPTEAPTEAPTATPATPTDMLEGAGGFEDSNFAVGEPAVDGFDWNWVTNYKGTATLCPDDDATTEPAGNYLQIQGNGSNDARMQWESEVGDVEGETEYILKFYIQRNSDAYPYISLSERGTNSAAYTTIANFHTQKNKTAPTISINGEEDVVKGVWTPVEYRFTTSTGTNQLRIRTLGNSSAADYCLDEITIVKYDASAPTPTVAPTEAPTAAPTEAPTAAPTEAPTAAPTAPADILEGVGGFEDFVGMGNGWNWYSGEKTATLCPDDDATTEPTGNYLQITDNGSMQWASEVGAVEGETEYTLKFYIKRNSDSYPYIQLAENGTGSFTTIANLHTQKNKTAPSVSINGDEDVEIGVWTPVEYRFTTSAGTSQLRIRAIGNGCTDYCLDDITIEKYDASAPTPTVAPTVAPETPTPTVAPTEAPTAAPTEAPTAAPTETPTDILEGIGGFEDFVGMGNGWNWYNGEKTATLCEDDDATTEPTGKYLQITDNGSMQWASGVGDVEGETEYTLKFYIKRNSTSYPYIALAENGTGSFTTIANLHTQKNKTAPTVSINGDEDVEIGVWTPAEYRFTTSAGTSQLRIRVIGNGCTDYCLDDITIVKYDPNAPTPTPTVAPATPTPTVAPETPTPTATPVGPVDVLGGLGDFETFTEMGNGWAWQSGGAGTITLCQDDDAETLPEGQYVQIQSIDSAQPKMQLLSTGVVEANTEYVLTFYIKKNTPLAPILYVAEGTDPNGTSFGNATVTVKTTGVTRSKWTKVTRTFTTGEDTARLRIRLWGGAPTAGIEEDFCIDGLTIIKASDLPPVTTPEAPVNLLENIGEFEDFIGMGTGWNWYSTPGTATLCPDDDEETAPVGSYLTLKGDDTNDARMQWVSEVGDVKANTKYVLRFYIRRNSGARPYVSLAERGTNSAAFTTIVNLHTKKFAKAPGVSINGFYNDVAENKWTLVDYRFTTSEDTNQLRIRVMGNKTKNSITDFSVDGFLLMEDDGSIPVPTPKPSSSHGSSSSGSSSSSSATVALTPGDLLNGAGEFENPSFAIGGDWKWVSKSEGTFVTCPDDNGEVLPNGRYLQINSSGTVAPKIQWASKTGAIEGNTDYIVRFYIKRNSDLYPYVTISEKVGSAFTEIVTFHTNKNKKISINGEEVVEKGVWEEVIYRFTTSEGASQLRVRITGGTPSSTAESFCIDGFIIAKDDGSIPLPTVAPSTPAPTMPPATPGDVLNGVGEFEDPYFEMGNGWNWVSNSEGSYMICPDDDDQTDPVGQYLRILSYEKTAPKIQWASKPGEVEGNTDYVLMFYIKRNSDLYPYLVLSEKAGDAFTDIVTLHTNKNKTSGTTVSINGEEAVAKGEWTKVMYPFTTSEDISQLRIRIIGGTPNSTTEDFAIDGLMIMKASDLPPTPTEEPIPESTEAPMKEPTEEPTLPVFEEPGNSNVVLWIALAGACVILAALVYVFIRRSKATKE